MNASHLAFDVPAQGSSQQLQRVAETLCVVVGMTVEQTPFYRSPLGRQEATTKPGMLE